MITIQDGVSTTTLGTEVWYRVEVSAKGENDWCTVDSRTFDAMITAKCALDRHISLVADTDETDYRIVQVTTHTAEVKYV